MRVLLTTLLVTCVPALLHAADDAYRLVEGDGLSIHYLMCPVGVDRKDPPGIDTVVPPGGVLTLPFVGQVVAKGCSVEELQRAIALRLVRRFPRGECTVVLTTVHQSYYSVLGEVKSGGQFELRPGLTLREALARAGTVLGRPEKLKGILFRNGTVFMEFDVYNVRATDDPTGKQTIGAGDVVSIQTKRQLRVWVAGLVKTPGQRDVEEGTTLKQLLSDVATQQGERPEKLLVTVTQKDAVLPQGSLYDVETGRARPFGLADGDYVSVATEETVRVWVFGAINKPGQFDLGSGSTVLRAIATAGGPTSEATLRDVRVHRGDQTMTLNLRETGNPAEQATSVRDGDVITVGVNTRRIAVLGEVKVPGLYTIADEMDPRLSDVISLAGGLTKRGPAGRIVVIRTTPDNRAERIPVDFSRYLKKHDIAGNPPLQSGDVVEVGETHRIDAGAMIAAVLSAFIGLRGLLR